MTFDITGDRDGQSVKTEYAVRRIPVLSGYWISASNANLPTFEPVGRATSSKLVLGRRRPGASRVAAGQRHRVEESLSDHRPPDIGPQPQAHAAPPPMDRNKVPESIICAINGHTSGTTVDKQNYVANGKKQNSRGMPRPTT